MSRGEHHIEGRQFRIWTVRVSDQNRIRVPLDEFKATVPWLASTTGPVECAATPGVAGGIQLIPMASYEAASAPFIEALGGTVPSLDEAQLKWVDAARLLATSWSVSIQIERNRISITLPEPARRASQLPLAGDAVVVFAFGEIVELWDAVKWHHHVRALVKDRVLAISEATEDLEGR